MRGKLLDKWGGILRKSVSYKRQNAYIISVQLDEQSREKLRQLCAETGFSMSHMVKTLIMGARVQNSHKIQDNFTPNAS